MSESEAFFVSQEEIDEFFEHVGVKGMKWGVRRDERDLATAARLRRVEAGTASKLDIYDTFIGRGRRGGLGGVIGIKTAGSAAARIEGRVEKRQNTRAANADKAAAKAVAKEAAPPRSGLSPTQRKALVIGGAAAVTVGAAFVGWKLGDAAGTKLSNIQSSKSSISSGRSYVDAFAPNMRILPDGSAIPTMLPVRR